MTDNPRIVAVVKGQLSKFSRIISRDLLKDNQRLLRKMIYRILAGEDVKLPGITRSLNESVPLINTGERVSRNPDDRVQ